MTKTWRKLGDSISWMGRQVKEMKENKEGGKEEERESHENREQNKEGGTDGKGPTQREGKLKEHT